MQLLVINQLSIDGVIKIRFCLMNVLVNGQWSMVKIRPTSFLSNEIFSLQFNKSFQTAILYSPLTIHHSPRHGFALLSPTVLDG